MGLFSKLFGRKEKSAKTETKTKPRAKKKIETKTVQLNEVTQLQKSVLQDLALIREKQGQHEKILLALSKNAELNSGDLADIKKISEDSAEILIAGQKIQEKILKQTTLTGVDREKPKIKLSGREQAILEYIKKKKEVQAGPVADMLGISRSNASLKLNKLYSVGYLDKRQEGKDMFYKTGNQKL